jgi:hypothetical protein
MSRQPSTSSSAATRPTRTALAGSVLAFLASRALIVIVMMVAPYLIDTLHYFQDIAYPIATGHRAYTEVAIEYPPLAVPLFTLPALLLPAGALSIPFADPRMEHSFKIYRAGFAGEMLFFDALAFVLIARACARDRIGVRPLYVYTLLTLLLQPVIYDRFDLAVGALLLLALAGARGGLAARAMGWLAIAAGFFLKFVPIVALPLVVLFPRADLSPRRRGLEALLFAGAPALLALGLCYASFGDRLLAPLRFQGSRGIQIESSWASLALAASPRDARFTIDDSFGAQHLKGGIVAALEPLTTPVTVTLVGLALGLVLLGWRRRHAQGRLSPGDLPAGAIAVLLALLAGSKVFSPQFLLWIVPLAPLAWTSPAQRRARFVFLALLLACVAVSIGLFRFGYWQLVALERLPVALLAVRNALVLALAIGVVAHQLRGAPAPLAAP